MRKLLALSLVAFTFAAVSCKKEETASEKIDKAADAAKDAANDATKK